MNVYTEEFRTKIIFWFVLILPGAEFFCQLINQSFLIQEEIVKIVGGVLFLVALVTLLKKKEIAIKLSDIFLLTLIFFTVLSIVTSLNIEQSILGNMDYNESPLQTVGYLMLFFVASTIQKYDNRKKIMLALMGMFILHLISVYAQRMYIWPCKAFFLRDYKPGVAFGLTQNSNFVGGVMALAVACFTSFFVFDKDAKRSKIWFSGTILSYAGGLFCVARLFWVGTFSFMLFLLIFGIICCTKKIETGFIWKRFIGITAYFGILFVYMFLFDPLLSARQKSITHELKEGGSFGSGRGRIWKAGVLAIKKRPLLGMGYDNYRQAFWVSGEFYKNNYYQDKGHNEYLHYIVTQGIPSGINYIAFCIYTIVLGIKNFILEDKNREKILNIVLVTMAVGYFAQAMFNSSITNVAVYKWVVIGLILNRASQKNLFVLNLNKERKKHSEYTK